MHRKRSKKVDIVVEGNNSIECSVSLDKKNTVSWNMSNGESVNSGESMSHDESAPSFTSISNSTVPDNIDYCGALNPVNVFSPRGRAGVTSRKMILLGSESESHDLTKLSSSSSYPSTITSAVSSGSSDKHKAANIISASDSATSSVRKVFS